MDNLVLTTEYFGPISSYVFLTGFRRIYIEMQENYQKKSFRNRCYINGPQGILSLSVPLQKGKNMGMPISEVLISYDEDWISDHLKAMQMGYNNSPFYEYYIDDISDILGQRKSTLIELNDNILSYFIETLDIDKKSILTTENYRKAYNDKYLDLRSYGTRSKRDGLIRNQPYVQPFDDGFGYTKDLSILDLLFCLGPEASLYIENEMI